MPDRTATPLTYLAELAASTWSHSRELLFTGACAVAVWLSAFGALSPLRFQAPGSRLQTAIALLLPLFAMLAFAATAASWRLYRRQGIALATSRTLIDLNAAERADFEHRLRGRYRRREARIDERNQARVERLDSEIAALHLDGTDWP